MDRTLTVHAIVAPAASAVVASAYFKRSNHTTPLRTASAFLAVALMADAGLVAPLFEKSYAMFGSIRGTWLPLASIFLAAVITGNLTTDRG